MRTERRVDGDDAAFVFLDTEPRFHQGIQEMAFTPTRGGFARTFPTGSPGIERAYAAFARHAEAMVRQAARVDPTPWSDALAALLDIVPDRDVDWWLAGSGALAVRGLDVDPRDLDLVVGSADADRFAALLADHAVEPASPGWVSRSFGRAFLHARIEWLAGIDPRANEPLVGDFGPAAARRLDTIDWRGRPVRVPPLDLQLAVNERRGMKDRVAQIRRLLDDARDGRPPPRSDAHVGG